MLITMKYNMYLFFFLILLINLFGTGCSVKKSTLDSSKDYLVYTGTYTRGESEGIYIYRLNMSTGELTYFTKATGIENPSFLAFHPDRKYLYSVNQQRDSFGFISAFKVDSQTGELTFINKQSSEGAGPCHVSVDKTGKWVLAANYTEGNVCILPVREDGNLGAATDVKIHEGKSVHPNRQTKPHPHSIWISPDNRFAFVPDLGLDKIFIYKLDLINGKLIPNDPASFDTKPGAGPRHFTFHPNGTFGFVINELNSTITSLNYDAVKGSFSEIETVSTLPKDFVEPNTCADIHTTPNGQFVYGSNRGHDSIAAFLCKENGKLVFVETESTQGKSPRNFAIDPTGKILLAANQNTDNVVTYWINQDSGELTPTGFQAKISMPVCLKLVPVP